MLLSKAQEQKVIAWRGGPYSARLLARLEDGPFESIARAYDLSRAQLSPDKHEQLKERLAQPLDGPRNFDHEVEACLLSILGYNDSDWDRREDYRVARQRSQLAGAALVRLWCEQASPLFALQTLFANFAYLPGGRLCHCASPSGGDPLRGWEAALRMPRCHMPKLDAWKSLRLSLVSASEESHREALSWAQAQENAPVELKWALAFAFPELGWADALALQIDGGAHANWGLWASIQSEEACRHLAQCNLRMIPNLADQDRPTGEGKALSDYLWTAVARLGPSSESGLRHLLEAAWRTPDIKLLTSLLGTT